MFLEELAYTSLNDLEIPFVSYEHEPIFSVLEAAEKGIVLPGQQVKNLLLKNKKGRQFYLVILPDEKTADIKRLAEKLGEKRLSFASSEDLEKLLRVQPGSVTPFGLMFDQGQKVQVIIDEEVDPNLMVGFHPFVNHVTVTISYADFDCFLRWCQHPAKRIAC